MNIYQAHETLKEIYIIHSFFRKLFQTLFQKIIMIFLRVKMALRN